MAEILRIDKSVSQGQCPILRMTSGRITFFAALWVSCVFAQRPMVAQPPSDAKADRRVDATVPEIATATENQIVEFLRRNGDPNAENADGKSMLLQAWLLRRRRTFDLLLEMGADPHQLLSRDVTINIDDYELTLEAGSSIVFNTIRHGYARPEFVEPVLRYLKRPDQRNSRGETLLHALVVAHRKRLDRDKLFCHNNPPNHLEGNLPLVLIFNAGADIDAVDDEGMTALARTIPPEPPSPVLIELLDKNPAIHFGIESCSEDMALRWRGANPWIVAKDGTTYVGQLKKLGDVHRAFKASRTLSEFLESGQVPIVPPTPRRDNEEKGGGYMLFPSMFDDLSELKSTVTVKRMPDGKRPPLSQDTHLPIVIGARSIEALVENGVDLNKPGKAGFTYLFAALTYDYPEAFKKLIVGGAVPDLKLTQSLWFVEPFGGPELTQKRNSEFTYAFWPDAGESVLMAICLNPFCRKGFFLPAIEATKEPNQRDELGRSLLHLILYHALLKDQERFVDKLIEAGVDVNSQSIGGATPSHVAVAMNTHVIPTLVKAGADLELKDTLGRSVLDLLQLAIQEEWGSKNECRKVLEWVDQSNLKPKSN
jgi:ankyrin repeat protein